MNDDELLRFECLKMAERNYNKPNGVERPLIEFAIMFYNFVKDNQKITASTFSKDILDEIDPKPLRRKS